MLFLAWYVSLTAFFERDRSSEEHSHDERRELPSSVRPDISLPCPRELPNSSCCEGELRIFLSALEFGITTHLPNIFILFSSSPSLLLVFFALPRVDTCDFYSLSCLLPLGPAVRNPITNPEHHYPAGIGRAGAGLVAVLFTEGAPRLEKMLRDASPAGSH